MAAQEEGGVASLEKDTQFLKKMFYGCPFSGTTLPGHGAGNACYLCLGVGVPTTKSFGQMSAGRLSPFGRRLRSSRWGSLGWPHATQSSAEGKIGLLFTFVCLYSSRIFFKPHEIIVRCDITTLVTADKKVLEQD